MEVKIFSNNDLSNEDYHSETEHSSGSYLWKLLSKSPAHAHFPVEEDVIEERSRALEFGSCAHTNLLERSKFDAEYIRMTMPGDEVEGELLTTAKACESFLKAKGIKGYSGKSADEVADLVMASLAPGEKVSVLRLINRAEQERADKIGAKLIRGDDYDKCMKMREVLLQNNEFSQFQTEGEAEVSIFAPYSGDDPDNPIPVKVRLDFVYDWTIIDYKTTISAHPDDFGRQCYNAGYYLKMALQHDVFTLAYGRKPKKVILLAQEKKYPFPCVTYVMTDEQLAIGRSQYRAALQMHRACKVADVWPTYGGGNSMELPTPAFVKNMYKEFFNDSK